MRGQLNDKLSEISKQHIDEVASLYGEMMERNYQGVASSVTAIIYLLQKQDKAADVPLALSQLPNSVVNIINSAFENLPSLVSLSLVKNGETFVRIEQDPANGELIEVEPSPIALDVVTVHGEFQRAYSIREDGIYFEPPVDLRGGFQLIIQLSPKKFFDSIKEFLEQRNDVGFYLVDKYNGVSIATYHQPQALNPSQISQLIKDRSDYVEINEQRYKVLYYVTDDAQFSLLTVVPDKIMSDGFVPIINNLSTQLLLSFVFMLLCIYFITRYTGIKLNQLSRIAGRIARFDFSAKQYPATYVEETEQLASAMRQLETTIKQMLDLIVEVSSADSLKQLSQTLNASLQPIFGSKLTLFYIFEEQCINAETGEEHLLEEVVNYATQTQNTDQTTTYKFELHDERGKLNGVLFLRSQSQRQFSAEQSAFVTRLSKLVAISLSKYQLLKQQKDLLAAFTKAIASAVDAKSPHTGGHCQRVPELTMAMVKAAQDDSTLFGSFNPNEEQLEEIFLAAWLHDCGKLTTQDHVIDKSTKLDMFSNRIHEIRTRFEIIKRDIHIQALKQAIEPQQQERIQQECRNEWRRVDREFEFVAKLNLGETPVNEHDLAKLQRIAEQSYVRTLNASLGLSWEEKQRTTAKDYLVGVHEPLLEDKANHIVKWDQHHAPSDRFTLQPPRHKYNFGEVYNLSITRGTLTPEERFLINDHIIQTIKILETLPYPDYLAAIPLIAGGHHEKMSGDGYPQSIEAEHLPLSARMLAIADIFEALTAKDRPYKTPKSISQALTILAQMAKTRHIDSELLTLFIEQKLYLSYAEKHLNPDQIDDVDHASLFAIYQDTAA